MLYTENKVDVKKLNDVKQMDTKERSQYGEEGSDGFLYYRLNFEADMEKWKDAERMKDKKKGGD